MLKVSFNNLFYSVLVFNNQLNKLIHSSISIKVERGGRNILAVAGSLRGGDTSMAGMAIAIPGVSNISKTGDTMGKIR